MKDQITLVLNGKWFIPANSKSYLKLSTLGFPVTRIHTDQKTTLLQVLRRNKLQARVRNFSQVLKKFQDQVAAEWLVKENRTADMQARRMVFQVTRKKETKASKNELTALKLKCEKFLQRWGYSFDIQYSELRGMGRLNVEYTFGRDPIIQVKADVQSAEKNELLLGRHRLLTRVAGKYFHWWLEAATGPSWITVNHGRCLLTEVGDSTPMLSDLMTANNKGKA